MPEQTTTPVSVAAPPTPPRPINGFIVRRAWSEPRVRSWWLIALAVLLVMVYLGTIEFLNWHSEKLLITNGQVVQAIVRTSGELSLKNQPVAPGWPVTLEFDWHGQPHQVTGTLDGMTEYTAIGKAVPIRVDGENPDRWTARTEPVPLLHRMIGPLLLLPVLLIFILMAWIIHRKTMLAFHTGIAVEAVVVERRHTPIAPLANTLRCTLRQGRDKTVYTVFAPATLNANRGDVIWLLSLPGGAPGKANRPVAIAWFS